MLLLAKAVVVAVGGHEWVWPTPKHPSAAGLVYLYAAVVSSLACLSVLRRCAEALMRGRRPLILQRSSRTNFALCLPLCCPCCANTARCGTGWEEHSVSNQGEAAEPLLEKGLADAGQGGLSADRRGTITLLLHYSSYDLPLLLLAFSAGAHTLQLAVQSLRQAGTLVPTDQLPRVQVPWLRSRRR